MEEDGPAFHTRTKKHVSGMADYPRESAERRSEDVQGAVGYQSPSPSAGFGRGSRKYSPTNIFPVPDRSTNPTNDSMDRQDRPMGIEQLMTFLLQERAEERRDRRQREERESEEREVRLRYLEDIQSQVRPRQEDLVKPARLELPPFDDREDLDSYLTQFERLATVLKWDRSSWAIRLSTKLRGKAREVLDRMSADEATHDYDALKKALLDRYQLTAETYRIKLRSAKKGKDESYPQFVVKLDIWLRRWIALSKKDETFEDLRNLLLLEQMLEGMTPELAKYVKERKPQTVKDAAEIAETYLEARRCVSRDSVFNR